MFGHNVALGPDRGQEAGKKGRLERAFMNKGASPDPVMSSILRAGQGPASLGATR